MTSRPHRLPSVRVGLRISWLALLLATRVAHSAEQPAPKAGWEFGGYYPPGSLGYQCWTNWAARTNAGRLSIMYQNIDTNGWVPYRNGIFYAMKGYSGLSMVNRGRIDGGGENHGRMSLITRRHAVGTGHIPGSSIAPWRRNIDGTMGPMKILFIGNDGATNTCWTMKGIVATNTGDYCIVVFSNDVPATVDVLPVAEHTNVLNKFAALYTPVFGTNQINARNPRPIFWPCQHGLIGNFWSGFHSFVVVGDSGSPVLIPVGNTLVLVDILSSYGFLGTNFMADLNRLTVTAGLNTNRYQPTYFDLSGFSDP